MTDNPQRSVAYLKDFVSQTFERHMDGVLDQGQAASLIWKEIENVFLQSCPGAFREVGRIRVTIAPGQHQSDAMRIAGTCLSARLAGIVPPADVPPEHLEEWLADKSDVLYLDVEEGSAKSVALIVDQLRDKGFFVRDWSYGY